MKVNTPRPKIRRSVGPSPSLCTPFSLQVNSILTCNIRGQSCLVLKLHKWNHYTVYFQVQLLSLNIVQLALQCMQQQFVHSHWCINTDLPIFCRDWGYFHLDAVMNNVLSVIHVFWCTKVHILLAVYLGEAGYAYGQFQCVYQIYFPKWLQQSTFSFTVCECSSYCTFTPTLVFVSVFNSYSDGFIVPSHNTFIFHLSDNQ